MFDPHRLLEALATKNVKFIILGGVAANLHGAARVTFDLDICYERSEDNLKALSSALSEFRPRLRGKNLPDKLPFHLDVKTLQTGLNFTLQTDVGPLDLFGEIISVGEYSQALKESEEYEIYGFSCKVLNLDALIRNKRSTGRNKDLAGLVELEALKILRNRR